MKRLANHEMVAKCWIKAVLSGVLQFCKTIWKNCNGKVRGQTDTAIVCKEMKQFCLQVREYHKCMT